MNLSREKTIFFSDCFFHVSENVYEPAEDTFLLAEYLVVNVKENDFVLDVGTGCGILAVLAAKKAKKVVATDINPFAIRCAKRNIRLNNVDDKVEIREGNLFQPILENEKFTLILFNAPYLPSETWEQNEWLNQAWAGGLNGRRIIDAFIEQAPKHLTGDGKILLVQSSLSNIDKTIQSFRQKGLEAKVVAEKKMFFESIVLIQAATMRGHICFKKLL